MGMFSSLFFGVHVLFLYTNFKGMLYLHGMIALKLARWTSTLYLYVLFLNTGTPLKRVDPITVEVLQKIQFQ